MRNAELKLIVFLFIAISGCKVSHNDFVIGDWYRVDDYVLVDQEDIEKMQKKRGSWRKPPRPPVYNPFGLTFHSDGSVTFYLDFWRSSGESWEYLGESGKYSVTKDSLWLAMPSDSIYSRHFAWSKKGKNSMVTTGTNGKYRFNRFFTKINTYQQIDSIRQFISDGRGYLEEKAVSASGKTIWFKPVFGEPVLEHFTGNITKEEFQKLEFRYNWAEFMDVGDYSDCCDGREIKTFFYFEGREIKVVVDYENSSPMRFLWATSLMSSLVEKSAHDRIYYEEVSGVGVADF
jgi:hypothetical protein